MRVVVARFTRPTAARSRPDALDVQWPAPSVDRFERARPANAVHDVRQVGAAGAIARFLDGIGGALARIASGVGGGVVLGLSRLADILGSLTGQQAAPRALTVRERALLGSVYGDALDLDRVRVVRGGPNTFALPPEPAIPRGVGNTIYWPTTGPYAELMDAGGIRLDSKRARKIFVHEAAHTAQFQNGGSAYLADSIFHQALAVFSGRNRNEAYQWEERAAVGVPWHELNAEEQAHLIEDAYSSGILDAGSTKRLVRNGRDFTAYALDAVAQARRGVGWA